MENDEDFNDSEGDAGNDGMPSATRSETYQENDREEEASRQRADQVDDESSVAPPAKYAKLIDLPQTLSNQVQPANAAASANGFSVTC
ncbi:hypothetical protein WJX77_006386 [Trebouxia sp. C0004]